MGTIGSVKMPNILNFPNWEILSIEETAHNRLVRAQPLDEPMCHTCEGTTLYRFGTKDQLYLDLSTLNKRTGIQINRQRFKCRDCKTVFWQPLDVMDETRRMTKRLVEYLKQASLKKTFASLAEEIGVTEGLVRQIFKDHVAQLEKQYTPQFPKWLGMDEIYLLKKSRCVFTNLEQSTIIEFLKSRDKDSVSVFLSKVKVAERRKVEIVAIDMWRPYRDLATVYFPQATVVIDKFHVVRMANDGLDEVRKTIKADLTPVQRRSLKRDRYILLKRNSDLNMTDLLFLDTWLKNFPDLALAYRLKEEFYEIYTAQSKEAAIKRYRKWKDQIPTDPKHVITQAYKPLVTAVENWQTEIFNYFDHPVTNSVTERLNGLAREVFRLGRGYSVEVLRAKLLFSEGVRVKKPGRFPRNWPVPTVGKDLPGDVLYNYLGLGSQVMPQPPELDFGADISTLIEKLQQGEI